MTRTALVTGASGQDAWFLAEVLTANGWKVWGATRQLSPGAERPAGQTHPGLSQVGWDPENASCLNALLARFHPGAVFNLAARSSGQAMNEDPEGLARDNALLPVRILESIRGSSPDTRFCQAGSSEMFGDPDEAPQTEATRFRPRSAYGAAKVYAHTMVQLYRERHGLHASNAILYNHESPRRPEGFVSRKVTRAAARIRLGLQSRLELGDLNARRDWGYAGDFVEAMRLIVEAAVPSDYVVATGELHTLRELCEIAFQAVGLDYRQYVVENPALFRVEGPVPLVGDASHAGRVLGWRPRTGFREMINSMVAADLLVCEPAATRPLD